MGEDDLEPVSHNFLVRGKDKHSGGDSDVREFSGKRREVNSVDNGVLVLRGFLEDFLSRDQERETVWVQSQSKAKQTSERDETT